LILEKLVRSTRSVVGGGGGGEAALRRGGLAIVFKSIVDMDGYLGDKGSWCEGDAIAMVER
jgi:hypothetical protein